MPEDRDFHETKRSRDEAMGAKLTFRPARRITLARSVIEDSRSYGSAKIRNKYSGKDRHQAAQNQRRELDQERKIQEQRRIALLDAEAAAEKNRIRTFRNEAKELEDLEKKRKIREREELQNRIRFPEPPAPKDPPVIYPVVDLPDGRQQLRLDAKTVITLKPGADPEQVRLKFMSRNINNL